MRLSTSIFCLLVVSVERLCQTIGFDYSEESSDSIEIPDRPEDRQASKTSNGRVGSDDRTFLNLISKVVGTFQGSVVGKARRVGKKSKMKYFVRETKKALSGINKAFAHLEKAKKKLSKHSLYQL